jgi:replicative DNA helicase
MIVQDKRMRPVDPTPERSIQPLEGRVPPNDLDAEGAVLSSILLSQDAFDEVHEVLTPEYFYSDANRRIYEIVVAMTEEGTPVDLISVASRLKDRGRLDQVGGTPYLHQLANSTPAVSHVASHAEIIRQKWRLRKLVATCQSFAAEAYGDTGEVQGFIDSAEQAIFDIARVSHSSNVVPVNEAIHDAFRVLTEARQRGGAITGHESGFVELDRLTSGLHKGDLYIVAGRPGMGKTAFVLNMAVNVASPSAESVSDDPYQEAPVERPGKGVAFFSLEMPREQLAARMLACEARVDMKSIRSGSVAADDWNKLTEAAARLGRLPIWLDDSPALGILDLRAKIRRLQAEFKRGAHGKSGEGLGLVAVDYLQLMQGRRGVNSREQEISEISRGLKQLAKEMQVPVLALSQLNRSVETRGTKDKRPQLSDLRDTIMFIYRDEYYFRDTPDRGIAEVIVAKQRNGPTGVVRTKFSAPFTRFDNLAEDEYDFDEYDEFSNAATSP